MLGKYLYKKKWNENPKETQLIHDQNQNLISKSDTILEGKLFFSVKDSDRIQDNHHWHWVLMQKTKLCYKTSHKSNDLMK